METPSPPPDAPLPPGVRSRLVNNGNGLDMHILESGYNDPQRPCILLLHGFPELAYSWREVLPVLAAAGYYCVAPDQRGYGRTQNLHGDDSRQWRDYRLINLMLDTLGLLNALERTTVKALVGHDFGSILAAICALVRPDVFRSVVLMSAPFGGFTGKASDGDALQAQLAALDPPRKHYQWYFSGPDADTDMRDCPQGIHAFLRAYFHFKSADWPGNQPHPLASWNATELAKMPGYYIMDRDKNMAATVAEHMPDAAHIAACSWLPERQLHVYSEAFSRTGFQEALNWYRCRTQGASNAELLAYAGRSIEVPACYIAGANDWGSYQSPGALQAMQSYACSAWMGTNLIPAAGHWVQQEQPRAVNRLLLDFFQRLD